MLLLLKSLNVKIKRKSSLKKLHFQAFQYVDEFVSSWKQIWRNLAFHHLLINGSSAVNGCRQNEKVVSSESGEKYLAIYVDGFRCEKTTRDGLFHQRKHPYGLLTLLARSDF